MNAEHPILADIANRYLEKGEKIWFAIPMRERGTPEIVHVTRVEYGETRIWHNEVGGAQRLRYHGPGIKLSYTTDNGAGVYTYADRDELKTWKMEKYADGWLMSYQVGDAA
jgi:hypothetical protein